MRQLAAYSFEAEAGEGPSSARLDRVDRCVDDWLASKGTPTAEGDGLAYRDGRLAALKRTTVASSFGRIDETTLTEPADGGTFRTVVAVAKVPESTSWGKIREAMLAKPRSLCCHDGSFCNTLGRYPAQLSGLSRICTSRRYSEGGHIVM